ncbi:hypothetical protein GCM10027161_43840 [Microbispora hainanensis]
MPIELIRNRPETALELLRCATGMRVPAFAVARVEAAECTQPGPIEHRADSVVVVRDKTGTALLAVIVEVQLGRDAAKRFSWPVCVTVKRTLPCSGAEKAGGTPVAAAGRTPLSAS